GVHGASVVVAVRPGHRTSVDAHTRAREPRGADPLDQLETSGDRVAWLREVQMRAVAECLHDASAVAARHRRRDRAERERHLRRSLITELLGEPGVVAQVGEYGGVHTPT